MEQRVEDVINEDDKEIMDIIDHLDKALTEEPTRIVDDDEDSTVSAEVESTKVSNAATLEGAEKYTLVSTEPIVAVSFDAGTFFYKDSTDEEVARQQSGLSGKKLQQIQPSPAYLEDVQKRFIDLRKNSTRSQQTTEPLVLDGFKDQAKAESESIASPAATPPRPDVITFNVPKPEPPAIKLPVKPDIITFKITPPNKPITGLFEDEPVLPKGVKKITAEEVNGDEHMAKFINTINQHTVPESGSVKKLSIDGSTPSKKKIVAFKPEEDNDGCAETPRTPKTTSTDGKSCKIKIVKNKSNVTINIHL